MSVLFAGFLSEIERAEAALLAWGLVDGRFSEAELADRAERFLDANNGWNEFTDAQSLIDGMVRAGLIFRWTEGGYCYRSRSAETLRLMARLRQLFPRHLRAPGAWVGSPTLVADFRFLLRPRAYPRRNQGARVAVQRWMTEIPRLAGLQARVLHVLLEVHGKADGKPLAGFQTRAAQRILESAGAAYSLGTMVCAGTGSGKTLAFYLPALAQIAGSLEQDASHWVRVLALYPRNELLKDQFTETCRQVRRIKPTLREAGLRPIQIGAFFGPTPEKPSDVEESQYAEPWEWAAGGRICPFLLCPECNDAMVWADEDRKRNVERLICIACSASVESEDIALTRNSLRRSPPDILFSTTEMMNQRLTDTGSWQLFGVELPVARKPILVLLDEAHTYAGAHGAQVAYLLRRWRHRSQSRAHFVGLSATLMEAAAFFAQLTGLPMGNVQEVSPEAGEMMQEGMEYLLALRGDPVSGASLLSTTIQTAMLLRRVLDSRARLSNGAFGAKTFLFTDDLDVTNRMYFNLLDAEGLDYRGRPDLVRHPEGSLANLRASTRPDNARRFVHGQSWQLAEDLGHDLSGQTNVRIGRVSSQDSGVDAGAETIVATASLEVGFNDPDVGAVLQHKAPREASAFLQRKGRAGRDRRMRPWTVVVLSDFGRDRLAYQGYDLLFDPELRPRDLPLGNRHVLKMQAAAACLDWLSAQLPRDLYGWFWRDARQPAGSYEMSRQRQTAAAQILERVFEGGDDFDRLSGWISDALKISAEEVSAVMWDAPRALMTAVLPTLHRRFVSQWMAGDEPEAEYHGRSPLPEFLPSTLFSDLSLPEVQVMARLHPNEDPKVFAMPVKNALREFAPGRISRRFGIQHGLSRHWIPVDLNGPAEQAIEISSFCPATDRESLGAFHWASETGVRAIPVWRPFAVCVRHDAPRSVKDSSNAFLVWHSQLHAPIDPEAGIAVDLPTASPWIEILREIRFFTHSLHQPARVRRFTTGARATLNLDQNLSAEITTSFALTETEGGNPQPVALGYAYEADAVRVRLQLPSQWNLESGTPEKFPALRASRFRWRLRNDARLDAHANLFQRNWLAEISLAAVTANAVERTLTLPDAWAEVRSDRAVLSLNAVLDVIFQTLPTEVDDDTARIEQQRLTELRQLLREPAVLTVLDETITCLWSPVDVEWDRWLSGKFVATVAAAFRDAVQQICPDVDAESLNIDLESGPDEAGQILPAADEAEFWLSEDTPGGGGIIERLLPRIAEAPRRFLDLIRSALSESDFETTDGELQRLIAWIVTDRDQLLCERIANFRQAESLQDASVAFGELHRHLRTRGLHTSHSVLAALSSRILKPGSTERTDALISEMLDRWRAEESRLGLELDARSIAYALSAREDLDQALESDVLPIGVGQDRRTWRFNALSGLVWPRGSQARNYPLSVRSEFSNVPAVERWLVSDNLGAEEPEVICGGERWRDEAEARLIESQRMALSAGASELRGFQIELVRMLARPLDTGSLLVYPRLRGVQRRRNRLAAILELVTAGQIAPPEDDGREGITSRLIVKTARGNRDEVRELLESLLAVELLDAGEEIWLVSPWVSDLAILDNRAGNYSGLNPSWPKRFITLAELLAGALRDNPATRIHVITRPTEHNTRFCERLRSLAQLDDTIARLRIDDQRPDLHTKGFVTTSFALNGSMNFTRNGIEVLDETVHFETDAARVAQFRLSLHTHYP